MPVVKLTYFKPSGKYYTEGKYDSEKKYIHEIFIEVGQMHQQGKLPGLVDGSREFTVHIDPVGYERGYPALSFPYW